MTLEDVKKRLNRHGLIDILEVNSDYENWIAFEVKSQREAELVDDSLKNMNIFNWHDIAKLSYNGHYIVKAEIV